MAAQATIVALRVPLRGGKPRPSAASEESPLSGQPLTGKSRDSPRRSWINGWKSLGKSGWDNATAGISISVHRLGRSACHGHPFAGEASGGDGRAIAQGIQEGNYKRIRVKVYILPSTNVNDHQATLGRGKVIKLRLSWTVSYPVGDTESSPMHRKGKWIGIKLNER